MLWVKRNNTEIIKLAGITGQYALGNISQKINKSDFSGVTQRIAAGVDWLAEQLRSFTQDTNVSASKVFAAVTQVTGAINKVANLADEISNKANDTNELADALMQQSQRATAEIKSVTEASKTIADIAEVIHRDSIQTRQISEHGAGQVVQATKAMADIEESSRVIDQTINKLKQTAQEIDSFLSIIRGISSQTHLLALNASIEAARAGEHGRGFAVVAQEIQKLSEATKEAVNSANQLLHEINEGINETVGAVKEGTSSVQSGVEATTNARNSLETILTATLNVETQLAGANTARQKQLQANIIIKNVLDNMEKLCKKTSNQMEIVNYLLVDQARQLEETKVTGHELALVAQDLLDNTAAITLIEINTKDKNNIDQKSNELKQILQSSAQHEKIIAMVTIDHKKYLAELLEKHTNIEAVWTNFLDGKFVVSLPPAGILNATMREWFQEAVSGTEYISEVYISAISKRHCITVSLPIKNGDKIVGVIGADLKLN